MERLLGSLLAAAGMSIVGMGYLVFVLLVFWLPVMAWSVTRNIKQIRVQLERLNDTLLTTSRAQTTVPAVRDDRPGRLVT